jgi:hypothetical protein
MRPSMGPGEPGVAGAIGPPSVPQSPRYLQQRDKHNLVAGSCTAPPSTQRRTIDALPSLLFSGLPLAFCARV